MNLRHYLLALILGDAAAWLAWFLIVTLVNPIDSTGLIFVGFFLTLFLALLGFFTLLLTIFRLRKHDEGEIEACLRTGVRQGGVLSLLCTLALVLSAHGYFSIGILFLLLAAAGLIEYAYLSAETERGG